MATKNRVFSSTRVVYRQSILQSPTRKRTNTEVHDTSQPRKAFGDLDDTVDSDSSIEIFDGNLFSEKKNLKGAKDLCGKQPKPIHPFFLESRRKVALTSALSKSNSKVANLDENLRSTECVALRPDKVPKKSLNHTNAMETGISRRGMGSDINMTEVTELHNSTSMAVARSSGPGGRMPEYYKGKGSRVTVSKSESFEAASQMPNYSYANYCTPSPAVVYTRCEDEANKLVQTLESPLGFDLEWRVLWNSGAQERRTALVQLCDKSTILLIQVSQMKRFPERVLEVIESPNIVKTGANIHNDGEKLYRDFGITTRGLVELGALAHVADDTFSGIYKRRVVSLAKMVAMYLECNLVKSKERTSNWEADLNNKMVHYAANDAHAALMVHLKLLDLAKAGNKELDPTKYTSSVDPPSQRAGSTKVTSSPTPPEFNAPSLAPTPPRPQYMRAYNLWHHRNTPLDKMCNILKTGGRVEPLKESTVISYVVGAIQADTSLPFDMSKLLELVKMEAGSWSRHRAWLMDAERSGRGCCMPPELE
ncbi:ribonuclease H-like protein [Suillus discolor]|uniref:3'-5' exonuclease n=1 Tax=Suillus discolor TaxID=1912936 RepID=A0A9P7F7P6_9AGAM|nr:ribonuclease H-like protein [Suillus discolor]KAG2108521.1 ribonuclease H-like protein [Suillus discolor]